MLESKTITFGPRSGGAAPAPPLRASASRKAAATEPHRVLAMRNSSTSTLGPEGAVPWPRRILCLGGRRRGRSSVAHGRHRPQPSSMRTTFAANRRVPANYRLRTLGGLGETLGEAPPVKKRKDDGCPPDL